MAKVREYNREFFDRDYSAREAYARLWTFARRYRLRLMAGIVCGILTAGTLVPMFGMIQPALSRVESRQAVGGEGAAATECVDANNRSGISAENRRSRFEGSRRPSAPAADSPRSGGALAADSSRSGGALAADTLPRSGGALAADRKSAKITKQYTKARKFAEKFGIDIQGEDEALGFPLLFAVIILLPLVALLRLGFVFLNHYCLAWAGMKTVRDIRCELLRKVNAQSLQFYGRIDVGQLMSRCTSDPQQVQQIIQTVLQEVAQAPFEIAVSIGFIIWSAASNHMLPTLAVLALGFPLFMVPVVTLSRVIRKWSRKALERFSLVGSRIHELLTCVRAVKAYHTEEYEERRYEAANDQTLKATLKSLRWGLLVGPAVETVGILLLCAFLVWCFAMEVKLSAIVPMLAPLLIAYKPIKQLSKLQVQIEQGRAALMRLWSVLDLHQELPERTDAVSKTEFTDRIRFEDVCFRYDTAERDAVSHAEFEVERGRMVAVVGGTGSGKTTMSGLLSRFFDPQSGRVTMDGVDLRDIRIADLRRLIGAVQQETLLFNDTIEENIRYGSPAATHDEVVAAAKLANAHEFIMSQPGGYERTCGEKGCMLSGGERQRVAIARAILRNPPILVLDEATSALDTVTERLVQDALTNLMRNRTVFAIAHRLSTIRNADLILVMDSGRIVERGTHDELYALNGVYRKLCDMQKTN